MAVHERVWETAGAAKPWKPWATYILMATLVVVFVLQLIVDNAYAGRPVLWRGQAFSVQELVFLSGTDWVHRPWTLVTGTLAHGSTQHLLFNGLFLVFFVGPGVERILGARRFLAAFFVAGAIAGIVQAHATSYFDYHAGLFDPRPRSVGASGGLMALLGVLVAVTPKTKVYPLLLPVPVPLWVIAIVYVAIDALGAFNPASPIGNFAHLSGMALGLLYGWWQRRDWQRRGLQIVQG